jgi:hypothetical protein
VLQLAAAVVAHQRLVRLVLQAETAERAEQVHQIL